MHDPRLESVREVLFREAALIDSRNWDEWLKLFTDDVVYWIPAWKSDLETTVDPNAELSLVYYESRLGLEDRIFRLRTNASSASIPFPRTCHLVTNITAEFVGDTASAKANFQTLSYRLRATQHFYGSYDYDLVSSGNSWKIKRKKITVLNDVIDTVLDFYSV